MVDVTDFPDIKLGDEAVLFGRQGRVEITSDELSMTGGTILAEFMTVWGMSNQRVKVH